MKIEVLDHGYVEFIEAWGRGRPEGAIVVDDLECGIIEAARQSTQGTFRGWEQDEKLLKYLYDHKHATPFEFAGMVIEVQAPIFVFREWQRHRTQSYNEMSARYEPLPDLYYVPTLERVMMQSGKQGGNEQPLKEAWAKVFINNTRSRYAAWQEGYECELGWGIPKELARIGMPVGHYSRMRASANLRNWLAFLTLRMDPAAQWEIRQYANAVFQLIQQFFPRTAKLFQGEWNHA